jgi:Domain of unknown function (DUF3387)
VIGGSREPVAFLRCARDERQRRGGPRYETLRAIARDLVETVKKNASIDWAQKESVRTEMRVAVKRILRKYDYPPDKQERATALVIDSSAVFMVRKGRLKPSSGRPCRSGGWWNGLEV